MTEVSRLIVEVDGKGIRTVTNDLDRLEDKSEKAERATEKLRDETGRTSQVMNTYAKVALAGVAVGLAAMVRGVLAADDKIAKLSKRLNISTEALSEYRHVANLSGVSFETLTMGFQRMSRRLSEAAVGTGEAQGALVELGLSAQELNKLEIDKQFEIIADSLNALENDADKTRLAMKLFDSEGVALIQTMSDGSRGIREMREEAKRFGLTLSADAAKATEQLNDEITKLKARIDGAARATTHAFLPALKFLTNAALTAGLAVNDMGEYIGAGIAAIVQWVSGNSEGAKAIIKARQDEHAATLKSIDAIWGAVEAENALKAAKEGGTKPAKATGPITLKITKTDDEGIDERLSALNESLKTEEELIRDSYLERVNTVNTLENEGKIGQDERRLLILALEQEKQDKLTEIEEEGSQKRIRLAEIESRAKFSVAKGMANNLAMLMSSGSKRLFKIGKVAAIANALIAGYESAVHSYNAGSKVGGPVLGAAYAATSVIATGIQIQKIRSQEMSGGGSLSGGSAGGGGRAQAPNIPAPNAGLNLGQSQEQAENARIPNINVTVNGSVVGSNLQEIVANAMKDAVGNDYARVTVNGQPAEFSTVNG